MALFDYINVGELNVCPGCVKIGPFENGRNQEI